MKTKFKNILGLALVVGVSATAASLTTGLLMSRNNAAVVDDADAAAAHQGNSFVTKASYAPVALSGEPVDLTDAAEKSVHAVVHIKSTEHGRVRTVQEAPDIFDYFFGEGQGRRRQVQSQPRVGFGSGVILTKDGYIVTNNHVIDGADEISVTLNDNREFTGRVVGSDADTDLALIKIDADDLPYLTVGNSDDLRVGEWILAVGNPFNLTSTVTAGIVSAKARTLGVYNGGIESFIQTDAAINQGNSGGAMVNAKGELVGINAVLTSPTGSYAGYGFAIPTSIMTKVVADLREFGVVQRALLGIKGGSVSDMLNKQEDLGTVEGVYVSEVVNDGAAAAAGIEKGDVIVKIDGKNVKSMSELQERLANHRPGDKVRLGVLRAKKEKSIDVTLTNLQGNTGVVKNADMELLGASFKEMDEKSLRDYGLRYGLMVSDVQKGRFADAGIRKGFVITKVNNKAINSVDEMASALKAANSSAEQVLFISGYYPSGKRAHYSVDLSQE